MNPQSVRPAEFNGVAADVPLSQLFSGFGSAEPSGVEEETQAENEPQADSLPEEDALHPIS